MDDNQPEQHVENAGGLSKETFPSVILNENIEILYDKRLSYLDKGTVKAYAARDITGSEGNYFAMVCEKYLVPKTKNIPTFNSITNVCLVQLVDHGIVYWSPEKQYRYVFIYRNDIDRPLLSNAEAYGGALGLRSDLLFEEFIKPMAVLLRDFADRDFVHGNIHAGNVFLGGKNSSANYVLGDCLSVPGSYSSPAVYCSIERSLADPVARGNGTREDDLYAFGVLLAIMLRSHDPLENFSAKDIIYEKIEHGSYAALVGGERIHGAMTELLKGLLYDDPRERWSIDEIEGWIEGHRMTPKQKVKRKKAARPIDFNGHKHLRTETFAIDIANNISETDQIVSDGTLEQWLMRSMDMKHSSDIVDEVKKSAMDNGDGKGYKSRLASRMALTLFPGIPIMCDGCKIMPQGVGAALSEALFLNKNLSVFYSIIGERLIAYWIDALDIAGSDVIPLREKSETCKLYVSLKNKGYGLERCLYILEPDSPCMSGLLKEYFVHDIASLLHAFEDLCKRGANPTTFMDRHITAFIAEKHRKAIEHNLAEINSEDMHKQIYGCLKTLATLQSSSGIKILTSLTGNFAGIMDPVYERLHDRDLRKTVREKVENTVVSGDLSKIARIVCDMEMYKNDTLAFKYAREEYKYLTSEKENLEYSINNNSKFGHDAGHQWASVVSGGIAGIVILLLTVFSFAS